MPSLDEVRAKYPAYKDVDDKTLADALYNKYYQHADRREFDARIGLNPYQNLAEGVGTAVAAAPGQIQGAVEGVAQLAGEAGNEATREFYRKRFEQGVFTAPRGGDDQFALSAMYFAESKGFPRSYAGVEQALADPANREDFQRYLGMTGAENTLRSQARQSEIREATPQLDTRPGSPEAIVSQAVGSVAQTAPALIASILLANPLPAMAFAGLQSAGQAYSSGRTDQFGDFSGFLEGAGQEGLTPENARQYAGLYGAAEGLTELLPLSVFLKQGGKLVGRVVKGAAAEGIQEGVTEALQAAIDKGYIDPDMTLAEAWPRVLEAAAVGTVAGSISGGIAQGTQAVLGRTGPAQTGDVVVTPEEPDDTPVEERVALPAPETLLALPPPPAPPAINRRQPPAPAQEDAQAPTQEQIDYQAQEALRKTKQTETLELLQTARETITPLGTFTPDELPGPAVQRVNTWRMQTGRQVDKPITIEEMARAKVPQNVINTAIAARRPLTEGEVLNPKDIFALAADKNIVSSDANFKELAYRATGTRSIERMSQAQLKALQTTLERMPSHESLVTVPVTKEAPFTEGQYSKALDAVRNQGRFTLQALKDATGLKNDKDVKAVREAMVRRGQLVERAKGDYRLYDIIGQERQAVPDDMPVGAFNEYVVKKIPVSRVRVKQNGKSLGTFGSGTEARTKVSDLRKADAEKGASSAITIEPAEETAYGIMENRYDEQGNLLGQVVVDTARDEADARKRVEQRNTPADTGARYTATPVTPGSQAPQPAPRPKPAPPPALAGRVNEVMEGLNAIAQQRGLPLLGTKVKVRSELTDPKGRQVEGIYQRNLIEITAANLSPDMSTAEITDRLAQIMDHELIHALRGSGVLGPDSDGWKTISSYVRKAKRPGTNETYFEWADRNYAKVPGYEDPVNRQEEAIAEAFRVWAANKRNVIGKPAAVFRQIVEWFHRLLKLVPVEVFENIESGQLVRDALTPPGSLMPRAQAAQTMADAAAGAQAAQTAEDENALRVKSRQFLRARAQAREDRFGKSGPKTVLGTTASRTYDTAQMNTEAAKGYADKYRAVAGISTPGLSTYLPAPVEYLKKIADAQNTARHTPKADDVAKAYRALIAETRAMFSALGPLRIERWTADGAPYESQEQMLADIAEGRLRMRLTDDMFAEGPDNIGHPLNTASGYATVDGAPVTNNDLLRVVHDIYGKGPLGLRGTPRDDYNAYHEHAQLLSSDARKALATETLAQSAWHHYGPHLRRRDGSVPGPRSLDYLPPSQKEFAEQKAFLLEPEIIGADPGVALAAEAAKLDDRMMFSVGVSGPREFRVVTDSVYPRAGRRVDGLEVREDVPNMGSISASLDDYTVLRGVRAIPFRDFHAFQEPVDASKVSGRVQDLAAQIEESGEINPLIVVLEKQGPYILEGAHRVDALQLLGKKEFPAVVVVNEDAMDGLDIVEDDPRPEPSDPRQLELRYSLFDEQLPGGRYYGNPDRSPGAMLSAPDTPAPAFTAKRDGNTFFGGEMADEQIRMAVDGTNGATQIYLSPEEFLALADPTDSAEQGVYNESLNEGYKFAAMPSLVLDGYAGIVRITGHDAGYVAKALVGKVRNMPVMIYPKRKESMGLVTALEGAGKRKVPWPKDGRQENFIDRRGPRYSVGSEEFRRWFGDSKVVDNQGKPLVVYHGTGADFNAFDIGQSGKTSDSGFMGVGFYFSNSPGTASAYTNMGRNVLGSPNVLPVYLSMQNPFMWGEKGQGVRGLIMRGERLPQAVHEDVIEKTGYYFDPSVEPDFTMARVLSNAIRGVLVSRGHDGVIASFNGVPGEFVAFEPTQIKSAVANKGTYDAANPDIRYSINAAFGARMPNNPQNVYNVVDQRIDNWIGRKLSAIGRSKRTLLPGKALPAIFGESIFDARVKFQDRMLSVKEMIENIKDMGGTVTDDTHVYMMEQLAAGRTVQDIENKEKTLFDPLFAALQREATGKDPISAKEFEDYLYARHAPERNKYLRARGSKIADPSGMSDAEAETILDRVALAGKLPRMEALADMADAIAADTTRVRIESGLISQKAADSSPYEFYAPLRGKTEEDLDPEDVYDPQTRPRSGKGYTVGGREDRATTGRSRKAGDILGHLMLQNTEAVIRAEKNRVALSFMRLIQDNPTTGYGKILENAPTRQVVGANGMIREAGDPSYRQRPDIFTAKYKGKEIVAQVNDPRVARAMKSDYVTQSGAIVNVLGRMNRYLATVNTSLNPEFLISNLVRDMQTAGILAAQYDIPGMQKKIVTNAGRAMNGITEALRDTSSWDRRTARAVQSIWGGGKDTAYWTKMFEELQRAGGTTEFLGIRDLETHIRRLKRDAASTGLNPTMRQARDHISAIGRFIDDYNKVAENAFRLSAYVAARDAGVSVDKAAFLAKNLTVNFNKGGENKAVMNSLYLFYNASISGSFVLLNGLKNARVQKIVGGVVLAGVVQDMLNRVLSGDEDDNGVTDYDDIPDYVLEHNWVIMVPGSRDYVALPMPYGFNVFHNLGRNLSNAFSGSPVHSPGKSAMSTVMTAVNAFNPMGGSESVFNFIAPTIADPLVDLITNEDFAGNAIVPERPSFGVETPDSQKYWSNTGEVPKWAAEHLNSLTGGNEIRKGVVDISPETMQFWFDYATGATGKFITRNIELGANLTTGDFEDIEIGDIPFARRVVGSVTNRGNIERYYENATEVKTVKEELKLAKETGNRDFARQILARNPAQARMIEVFDKGEKVLSETRQKIRDLKAAENIPADRKRAAIDKLQEQQDRIMAQLNKIYFDRVSAAGQ